MKRNASMAKRLASAVLATVFLLAAGPDAYGLRPCPHHTPESADGHAPHQAHGMTVDERAHDRGHHESSHEHERCTCLQSCHTSGAVPTPTPPPAGPATNPVSIPFAPLLDADSEVWGPHHELFELHLPNAPPRST